MKNKKSILVIGQFSLLLSILGFICNYFFFNNNPILALLVGILLGLSLIMNLTYLFRESKKEAKQPFDILLRISAFLLPFYFVFYGPLHDKPENPKIKILWKYVLFGFLAYLIFFIIIEYVK